MLHSMGVPHLVNQVADGLTKIGAKHLVSFLEIMCLLVSI